jgi:thiol-disulfide isomerase/thioredoxin
MLLELNNIAELNNKVMKKLSKLVSATWCGHCHMFRSEWEQFKKNNAKKVNIVEIESGVLDALKSDAKLYKRLTPKDGMVYFPMLLLYTKKEDKLSQKRLYDGERTAINLELYIDAKSQKKTKETGKSGTMAGGARRAPKKSGLSLVDLNAELDLIIQQLSKNA